MVPMRDKASWRMGIVPALVSLLLSPGCITNTKTEDDNATNTFVQINSITSQQGTATGTSDGTDLFSDVCDTTNNPNVCQVFNDNGVVEMVAQAKDLSALSSQVNDIQFERYRVTYIRSDGRNVPGVDVPHPFDGVSSFRLPASGTAVSRVFVVVRQQAKLEPPLVQLAEGGAGLVLSVLAQIDFYGKDVAGRDIKVTGFLNITFADF